MKNLVLLLLLIRSAIAFGGEVNGKPEEMVRAFMRDYTAWNDRSYSASEQNRSERTSRKIEADYKELLKKYCLPDFRGEPLAFGSDSGHDPAREEVISIQRDGSTAVVATKHTSDTGFVADYEYHLLWRDGRWYLKQVYYVDSEGKYPGL